MRARSGGQPPSHGAAPARPFTLHGLRARGSSTEGSGRQIQVATALARLLTRSGNRVGAILYNNAIERTIPPLLGCNQVLRLTHHLLSGGRTHGAYGPGPPHPRWCRCGPAPLPHVADLRLHQRPRAGAGAVAAVGTPRGGGHPPRRSGRSSSCPCSAIVVEDAETGELLSVDTSDPEFRTPFPRGGHPPAGPSCVPLRRHARGGVVRHLHRGRSGPGARAHRRQQAATKALMSFIASDRVRRIWKLD